MTCNPFMRAAAVLALTAASAAAQAALESLPADAVLAESTAAITTPAGVGWVQPVSRSGLAFALARDSAGADGSLSNRGTSSLWIFITSVRAQQRGDTFSVLETNLSLVGMTDASPPSQVPLPAAAWCLLMGLLGMAGVRLTGQDKQRAGRESPAATAQPLPA